MRATISMPLLSRSIAKLVLAIGLATIASMAGVIFYLSAKPGARRVLVVSTTTSLYDTGLLELVEERFEERWLIDLYFISVGTGLAIRHAMRGDADAILVHAPSKELSFLVEGYGVNRKIIAYNFFAIVGPPSDPAGIKGFTPREALRRIVEAGRSGRAIWVSRGDDSGTHVKEVELWKSAGFDWSRLKEEEWFIESGSGMGKTLLVTDGMGGYTLTDMGTYLKYLGENLIDLEIMIGESKDLINVYSVIPVNPSKVEGVNFKDAMTFVRFLTSREGQTLIGNFKIYGRTLFYPAVELLKRGIDPVKAGWIREAAFFNGTECPPEYRRGYPELYEG